MKGSCLCGAVRIEARGRPRDAVACHCSQCRKQSGHYWASATVARADLTVTGKVRWYRSSGIAQRGFCPVCGSFLFWQGDGEDEIGVSLGLVDGPTGMRLGKHIFVADKGDYYDIADGLPQEEGENEP